jgi:uncharacterized protein (DUF362 family)
MPERSKVLIIGSAEKSDGIKRLFEEFDLAAKDAVALKANYNSDDPFPATTDPETLRTLISLLKAETSAEIVMAERSGMGNTARVLRNRGISDLSKNLGFSLIDLETQSPEAFEDIRAEGLHWKQGFKIARLFRQADRVVQTCCLKTHRFGGHFTMSLKNSVGLVAARPPGTHYDYMRELHSSPNQRLMIAEINQFYRTDMVLMDASLGFSTGGPERGRLIKPGLLLASVDRVALDAVGVAVLRLYGTSPEVAKARIFEQEQIARAAALRVGVSSANQIDLEPLDEAGRRSAEKIGTILDSQR